MLFAIAKIAIARNESFHIVWIKVFIHLFVYLLILLKVLSFKMERIELSRNDKINLLCDNEIQILKYHIQNPPTIDQE